MRALRPLITISAYRSLLELGSRRKVHSDFVGSWLGKLGKLDKTCRPPWLSCRHLGST